MRNDPKICGVVIGTNLIRPLLGAYVLHATRMGRADFMGMSFNSYDAPRRAESGIRLGSMRRR